jgi:hypothetical protein
MISILLIIFIILMVMSRNINLDLEIKGLESFNPLHVDEEVAEVKEVKKVIFVKEIVFVKEKDEEMEELLLKSKQVKSGSNSKQRDYFYTKQVKTKIRDHSRRGDHGHKGYTRVQTLAYKKAREFKHAHLNEWC